MLLHLTRLLNIRRLLAALLFACVFALPGCSSTGGSGDWVQQGAAVLDGLAKANQTGSIAAGLKEALRVGTGTVVGQLGAANGFNKDQTVRIPLPSQFNTMREWLGKVGMDGSLNDLETKLNRAAEAATPKAKELFWTSIKEMTLSDAKSIFNGPNDAATQYFKGKMSPRLKEEMSPIITSSLSQVGAIQKYEEVVGRYKKIPFVPELAPDIKTELTNHTLDGALNGIFHYLAEEESAIRDNPAKRTTELLRQVFGGNNSGQ